MRSQRCTENCINPFYIGPYPDQSCGCCPYGIYSGFVPCGWGTCCTDPEKINKAKCCIEIKTKADCEAATAKTETEPLDKKDTKTTDGKDSKILVESTSKTKAKEEEFKTCKGEQ